MPFSAINTYEQELKQRNERHTLELQLEQAMQIYQSALEAQRVGNRDEAHDQYGQLFAFDVISAGKTTLPSPESIGSFLTGTGHDTSTEGPGRSLELGPAIRLRAMALKNYALLLLSDENVEVKIINEAIGYLLEALQLVGSDDKEKLVLPSLVSVAWALGLHRLARLGLEILVQNNEKSALQPLDEWIKNKQKTKFLFGPRTIDMLKALDYMRHLDERTNGKTTKISKEIPKILQGYDNLAQIKNSLPSLSATLESESKIEVNLPSKSWEGLISAINGSIGTFSKRGKRKQYKDSYYWSTKDLWSVNFSGALFSKYKNQEESQLDKKNLGIEKPNEPAKSDAEVIENSENESLRSPPAAAQTITSRDETVVSLPASPLDDSKNRDEQKVEQTNDFELKTGENQPQNLLAIQQPPVKRRRTDRVKRSSLALPADFGIIDNNFAVQFNSFLSLIETEDNIKFYSPASLFLDPSQSTPSELYSASKLRDLLSGWDSRESSQFLMEAASSRPQKGGVMTTLRKGNSSTFQSQGNIDENEEDTEQGDVIGETFMIEKFIIAHENMHIQQIRWHLAHELLSRIAFSAQSRAFCRAVFKFIDEIESLLWTRRRILTGMDNTTIFALFADNWIRDRTSDLETKVMRWKFISCTTPSLLHGWITAFVDQEAENANPESSVVQFENILTELQKSQSENKEQNSIILESIFENLQEIPPLTVANAQMQISKFKAAAAFERVLTPPSVSDLSDGTNCRNDEDIQLLEAMLMPKDHKKPDSTSEAEFEAILNFLEYSQPQFKMGLWYILHEKYEANGSAIDSLTGLTQLFMEAIRSFEKGEPLLQMLSVAHDVGRRLVPLLERNPSVLHKCWDKKSAIDVLKAIVKLLQTLHLFLLYDDAINSNLLQKPITTSWPDAQLKFRELVVIWWCVFYRFWLRSIPEKLVNASETINDILSIVHERLGNLGYCGAANRCLLNLHLSEIARINWEGSALDLSQCLKCKFGLNLSLYGDAANHHTVSVALEQKDATLLLPFVMEMILKHRSFIQAVMRMDTRAVIDAFAKAYGKPHLETLDIRRAYVESYLQGDFSPKVLRNAWIGKSESKLSFPDGDDANGAWYAQALILMNQYRMRRRQAYSVSSVRTESLEIAISLFIDDISARPTRFESWAGLAQAYVYLCEDCLTFGDELAISYEPEVYCKKGLLATSCAISLLVDSSSSEPQRCLAIAQKEVLESFRKSIWPLFGYQLILATVPPLAQKPLHVNARPLKPLLIELPDVDNSRLGIQRPDDVDEKVALQIALKCLSKTTDLQQDWINAMHQCIAALRLKLSPQNVLKYAERASRSSPNGTFDAQVELTRIVWHFYRQNLLNANAVNRTLKKLPGYNDVCKTLSPSTSDEDFAQKLIESFLRWFTTKDKWLHRPHYFLAKIYELDHDDTKTAQKELMQLFTLKSPTKPLVIWKADSDLPGQHAVCVTKYVKYMTDLMFVNEDSAGLLLMARRFRRAGAEMWNHMSTYEYIYSQTCLLARTFLQLEAQKSKYSDVLMAEISDNSEKFESSVKSMSTYLENRPNQNDASLQALYYITELRRQNYGPATIAQADELLIVIFLTMLKRFNIESLSEPIKSFGNQDSLNTNNTTPSVLKENTPRIADNESAESGNQKKPEKPSSKKKLFRKDIIQAAQQFLRPFQHLFSKTDDLAMPRNILGSL